MSIWCTLVKSLLKRLSSLLSVSCIVVGSWPGTVIEIGSRLLHLGPIQASISDIFSETCYNFTNTVKKRSTQGRIQRETGMNHPPRKREKLYYENYSTSHIPTLERESTLRANRQYSYIYILTKMQSYRTSRVFREPPASLSSVALLVKWM